MSDPAIEAAHKAIVFQPYPNQYLTGSTLATFAAREALKPIRELHRVHSYGPSCPYTKRWCGHCSVDWPCDTAKLVYAAEELAQ